MRMIIIIILLVVLALINSCAMRKGGGFELPDQGGLLIVDFAEKSSLEQAGAQKKDILWRYDGKIVYDVDQLGLLKEKVTKKMVQVEVVQDGKLLSMEIPSGSLGVYLLPVPREPVIDKDATIIRGVEKLSWANDRSITFFGALTALEKLKGQGLSYQDLLVLSGYGFRTNFYPGFCPSSPDATCGFDTGAQILTSLGYSFDYLFLEGMEDYDEQQTENIYSMEEIKTKVKESIDRGWPVLAIDLIQIPEWGIITGYQKDGNEFFCRTYFDEIDVYELARKQPWALVIINHKKKVEPKPLYYSSLQVADQLYNTRQYGKYYNGLAATERWIADLSDEKSLLAKSENKFNETCHANSWTYFALSDSKTKTAAYLKEHKNDFGVEMKIMEQLCSLYQREAELLQNGIEHTASMQVQNTPQSWTAQMRKQQILVLQQYQNLELQMQQLLKVITSKGRGN